MPEMDPRLKKHLDDMYDRVERQSTPARLNTLRAEDLQRRRRRWPQALTAVATVGAIAGGVYVTLLVHSSPGASTGASSASVGRHPVPVVTFPALAIPAPSPTSSAASVHAPTRATTQLTYSGAIMGPVQEPVVTCVSFADYRQVPEQGAIIQVVGMVGGKSRTIVIGFDADHTTWHAYEGPTARMAGNQPTVTADYFDDARDNAADFAWLKIQQGGDVTLHLTDLRGAELKPITVSGTISCS